jgi:molybdopterin molybdotransferase
VSEPVARSYAEARRCVLETLAALPATTVPFDRCAGLALRADVIAPHALPPFTNSAMDGWAVRAADLAGAAVRPVTLPVVAVIAAGGEAPRALAAGEAMRIMTGAALPDGADSVLPFELGERGADERGGETMRARHAPAPGENVRPAGRDVAAGSRVLAAGRELSAHDASLLASLGVTAVSVGPRPRVAVISTGDELLDPSEPLRPGAIRDSNLSLLSRLATEAGGDVVLATRLPDDAARVRDGIDAALQAADVVLTVGGVSAGDFDPVKEALARFGTIELWRVEMRPGRPQAFGRPDGRLFFGLPGNPASVACVFEALVRPALRRLQGFAELDRPRVPVRLAQDVASRRGRTDFVRCELAWREGALWASPAGDQVSGHLSPQSRAHALVIVPESAESLAAGEPAEALLLRMPGAGPA